MSAQDKLWVDGPYKLISGLRSGVSVSTPVKGARSAAAEMTLIHNIFLRGANAIYIQAPNVVSRGSAQDQLDFAGFAHRWCKLVHDHHHTEETRVFPEIEKRAGVPGLMGENVRQHELFTVGVDDFLGHLDRVTKGEASLGDEDVREMLDGFMPALRVHLEDEIDTLVALEKYDDKCDWEALQRKMSQEIVNEEMSDPEHRVASFPLMFVLHDVGFEDGVWKHFPPVSGVMNFALRWLFMNKHANWWRFAGNDFYCRRKELPFA